MNNSTNIDSKIEQIENSYLQQTPRSSLDNLVERSIQTAGDMVKKVNRTAITQEQVERIIQTLSINLKISQERATVALMILFLQGAASAGAPPSMSVEVENGISMDKRNVVNACKMVTGHEYIRRIAEHLAYSIGYFASQHNLKGELATRINNRIKAETGQSLTPTEMAFCSSFSQAIPNLTQICGNNRLGQLLAEDYQRRFENKRKSNYNLGDNLKNGRPNKKGKKK